MSDNPTVLFVDDEPEILSALGRAMRGKRLTILTAENAEDALEILAQQQVDIVVSDKLMPGMNGVEFLSAVAEQYPEIVRIMLTSHTGLQDLIALINNGKIWGYLQKPWDNSELHATLMQAVQARALITERALLRHTVDQFQRHQKPRFQSLIGSSVAMQFIYNSIEQCAPSKASVFITGQSGTGKELVAEAIYNLSPRSDHELVCLNCAAIPSELMESEIFGHIKGAFSGAVNNRDGAASLANGGTLFLDELGEMDMALQAKILRFVQTGTFQRVGSSKTEKVDIRFICATNRAPMEAIQNNRLREDLYYRLNVISIDLPPLCDRQEDALQIAQEFLQQFSEEENKMFVGFSSDAEKLISTYPWPGNIRELQNIIHSCIVMSEGPLITDEIIARQLKLAPKDLQTLQKSSRDFHLKRSIDLASSHSTQCDIDSDRIIPLADVERSAIEHAIKLCEDNVVKAASLLDVSPSTVYRKIQQWENRERH